HTPRQVTFLRQVMSARAGCQGHVFGGRARRESGRTVPKNVPDTLARTMFTAGWGISAGCLAASGASIIALAPLAVGDFGGGRFAVGACLDRAHVPAAAVGAVVG